MDSAASPPRINPEEVTVALNNLGVGITDLEQRHKELTSIMVGYHYAIDQLLTRIAVLQEDLELADGDNPFEAVTSRVKKPASVLSKARRKGIDLTPDAIQSGIQDIAGVRITCPFINDIYAVKELLLNLPDVVLLEERDYISNPKPNGYKSLHLIVSVPIQRASGPCAVTVEIQIRTIAMDFWASLEHKIFYKYDGEVPDHVREDLRNAALAANLLDERMQDLRLEVLSLNE